jgi:signal transduction histidine kinase
MTTPMTTPDAPGSSLMSQRGRPGDLTRADAGRAIPGGRPDPQSSRTATVQNPPVELFRWASLAVSIVLATSKSVGSTGTVIAVGAVLVAYAGFRTMRPISLEAGGSATGEIALEFVLHTAAILLTHAWGGPFSIVLLPTVVLAGFARGYTFALQLGFASTLMVSVRYYQESQVVGKKWDSIVTICALWLALVIVVSLVASYGRHVLEHNAQQQTITLNRLGRLAEANALLFQLNKIAQTLPSSLDMGEVLDSTISRLRDLIHFDAITVLLLDESDRTWVPVRELGNPGQQPLPTNALPAVLQRTLAGSGASMENSLDPNLFSGPGLWPEARSGIYAALSARGSQIGLLALESKAMANFAPTDIEVLNGITDSFAYAVSNARLFARLRTIGAEEERTRIARDLHDQIGQALAHLGFELDRAKRANARGEDMTPRLDELRGEVGGVTRMVRDTLYDLRTDVTESQDVRQTMELFVSRVQERSGLEVAIEVNATGRMPLIQEREMWRIAKEAVVNVERHAKATHLNIRWTSDGKSAELVVADDGVGYDKNKARDDSYGIMGMKERAASIGAHLELESNPGSGTTIRVALANSPQ